MKSVSTELYTAYLLEIDGLLNGWQCKPCWFLHDIAACSVLFPLTGRNEGEENWAQGNLRPFRMGFIWADTIEFPISLMKYRRCYENHCHCIRPEKKMITFLCSLAFWITRKKTHYVGCCICPRFGTPGTTVSDQICVLPLSCHNQKGMPVTCF